ncbi:MAG TPA: hotdog fold thioesterase [Trueperaceae bacterium]|nr:hotdog fold thioesterase [Trueperaceae bacterium]
MSQAAGTFDLKRLIEDVIPFNRALGVELRAYDPEEGSVTLALPLTPEHVGNVVRGMPHGGAIAALVDAAAGAAAALRVPAEDVPGVATIDMRVDFLAPAQGDVLLAAAAVARAGRRVVVVRTEVRDAEGTLVALGTSAFGVARAGAAGQEGEG